MSIIDFLRARIGEDEYLARTCLLEENLHPYGDIRIPAIEASEWGNLARNYLGGEMGEHCAQQNPTRTLAEAAAKRDIMERHTDCDDVSYGDASTCREISTIAAIYRDHPDYLPEWDPDARPA